MQEDATLLKLDQLLMNICKHHIGSLFEFIYIKNILQASRGWKIKHTI